jgi:acyl dehydratase
MKVGDVLTVSRTFTVEEVAEFAALTRDHAPWHTEKDERGRLVVHGLLTAALATQIGGALGFMARDFDCKYLRPVWTGDVITLALTCTKLSEGESSAMGGHVKAATRLEGACVVTNQHGDVVARIQTRGVIPKPLQTLLGESLETLRARL